ncbi:alpha/beta hydrolase [Myxococcota bacterium]|nr:alpha/beta hydrolase [Myxococcota bacterium]MBU1537192.1 alpha/beta hydrolase [Myxococcota bacterium]
MYSLPKKRFFSLGKRRVAHLLEGDGSPALFIHGFPTTSFLFSEIIPAMAHMGFLCGAPDLMGLGDTLVPNQQDMGIESQGTFLYQYHRELFGQPRALVVGHELGAALALTLALQKPGMVRGLVLINPLFFDSWPTGAMTPLKRLARFPLLFHGLLRSGIGLRNMEKTLLGGFYDLPSAPRFVTEFIRPFRNSTSSHERLRNLLLDLNPKLTNTFSQHLNRVKIPTLIVHGEKDPFIPISDSHRLAGAMPGASMVTLRECGHFPPAEQPEIVASLITQFAHKLP